MEVSKTVIMRDVLVLLFVVNSFFLISQNDTRQKKNRFLLWTYHHKNTQTHGLSVGLGSIPNKSRNVITNGVKIEAIGVGLFVALTPFSPISESKEMFDSLRKQTLSEQINGISLSLSGTACNCETNGITLGGWAHYNYRVNGVSGVLWVNFTEIIRGVQFSLLWNDSFETKGVQIGLVNRSKNLKGFQFGLWNINQKRKLPLINWNFKN
jgi:hypothetical protein